MTTYEEAPSLSEDSKQELSECLNRIFAKDRIPLAAASVDITLDLDRLALLEDSSLELSIEDRSPDVQGFSSSQSSESRVYSLVRCRCVAPCPPGLSPDGCHPSKPNSRFICS